jgi:hypothetical protein
VDCGKDQWIPSPEVVGMVLGRVRYGIGKIPAPHEIRGLGDGATNALMATDFLGKLAE